MLDLQARVHLEKVEGAVAVEQELDGAGVAVADRLRSEHRGLAHAPPQVGIDHRRGGLLEHLLVSALKRALALAQRHHASMLIAQHLDLDVTRLDHVALDVDRTVTEAGFGLGARGAEGRGQVFGPVDATHALAATARGRLDHDREADARRLVLGSLAVGDRILAAGHHRYAGVDHQPPALDFRAHGCDGRRRRTDEGDATRRAGRSEVGILGQEAIARMHGIGADTLGEVDDGVAAQVRGR